MRPPTYARPPRPRGTGVLPPALVIAAGTVAKRVLIAAMVAAFSCSNQHAPTGRWSDKFSFRSVTVLLWIALFFLNTLTSNSNSIFNKTRDNDSQWRIQDLPKGGGRAITSVRSACLNGGLGAEPLAGYRGRGGSGELSPPEAESFLHIFTQKVAKS